eukprot:UN17468
MITIIIRVSIIINLNQQSQNNNMVPQAMPPPPIKLF